MQDKGQLVVTYWTGKGIRDGRSLALASVPAGV